MLNMASFEGGLNTALDPRDIAPVELSKAENVMFDINGILRCQGKGQNIAGYLIDVLDNTLSHGYGLFSFESSYTSGTPEAFSTTFDGESVYFGSEVYSHGATDADSSADVGSYWYIASNGISDVYTKSEHVSEPWKQTITLTEGNDIYNVLKSIYHIADEGVRVSNADFSSPYVTKNKWFGFIKQTNFFDGADDTTDYNFNGWYVLDNDIKKPTELDHLAGGDGGTFDGTSAAGAGFEMKIFATTGGGLNLNEDMTEEALIYDLAATFIYDGIQESLLYESEDETILESDGTAVVAADNNALSIQVAVKTGFNPRITGGRIYYKIAGSNDDYVLLCEIDFTKGIKASLDNTYADGDWNGTPGVNEIFISNIVTLTTKNIDTYSSLTEWGAREKRISIGCLGDNYPQDTSQENRKISEGYKCSTIVNRRTFIANCKLYHDETSAGIPDPAGGSKRERDRIYYSGMCSRNGLNFESAFDCFPRSNYIDVVKGDAEEYTALVGYADRLLAWKTNTLFVINIAADDPVDWFLESQHTGMGVFRPCQVTQSEDGVMWANTNGAYIYTGSEVRTTTTEDISFGADIKNISRDKIAKRDWFTSEVGLSSGYLPERQQFIIINNTGNGNSAIGYIYDFNTSTWSSSSKNIILPPTGSIGSITNFALDKNRNLIWGTLTDLESTGGEMIENGSFDQDVPQATDGYMNDDNGSDGYGGTVVGYPGTTQYPDEDRNQRVYVSENLPMRLYHLCQTSGEPLEDGIAARLKYIINDPLIANQEYTVSVDYNIGTYQDGIMKLNIRKMGTDLHVGGTMIIYPYYPSEGTMSLTFTIPPGEGGDYYIEMMGNVETGSYEQVDVQWGWNNLSLHSTTFANAISFNTFGNNNTIIGSPGTDRFDMPANSIDIRTKDNAFEQTGFKKRIYGIYVTYRTQTSGQTTPISYALNGASAYNNAIANWTNLEGDMSNTEGEWTVGRFKSNSPLTCQSLRLKITNPSEGIMEINDIAIEHRVTGRRVV